MVARGARDKRPPGSERNRSGRRHWTSVTSSLVRCDPIPGHPAQAGIPAHLWVFGSSQLSLRCPGQGVSRYMARLPQALSAPPPILQQVGGDWSSGRGSESTALP